MALQRLSKERVLELWAAYNPDALGWTGWEERALRDLQWVSDAPVSELRSEAGQKRLWGLQGLGTTGGAENYDMSPLYGDPEFVDLAVSLRETGFPSAPTQRGEAIQAIYNKMETRGRAVITGNFPKSRLLRMFWGLCPRDGFANFKWDASVALRRLLLGKTGTDEVEQFVEGRARLRELLGPEKELFDHVRRATFGWWLWEQREVIAQGHTPVSHGTTEPPNELELLPYHRRHKNLDMFQGGLDTLRVVLRECLEPSSLTLVQQALQDELDDLDVSDRYAHQLLRVLRHLGFASRVGEDYHTTPSGERLLDERAQPLIAERLMERYLQFAELMQAVEGLESFSSSDVMELLRDRISEPSLRAQSSRRLWWGMLCGTLERVDHRTYKLSERGRRLVARLPADLGEPLRDGTTTEPLGPDGEGEEDDLVAKPPTFTELAAAFDARCKKAGLQFTRTQLLALHSAWHFTDRAPVPGKPMKRFAILSGLSGTGKTQLLKQYALATCDEMGLDPKLHIAPVAVRPDWRDPTGLLGYLNALHAQPTFQSEPALELVLRAHRDPGRPYFLLLDEMNLARVERYFAPFLSSMENGARLHLHGHDSAIDRVPPTVPWPDNLRIGGSVNMDETTHPFSDKVLDRAFTLEFWDVDLDAFFAGRPSRVDADAPVEALLIELQGHLVPIRRHFGYRTAGEVLDWVAHAREVTDSGVDLTELYDQAVFSKVLPRLRGTDTERFRTALTKLHTTCDKAGLTTCVAKLEAMRDRLEDTGVTGFWA